MGTLGGKLALVSGAAQGIGLAIATRLAGDGARVVLLDRNEAGGKAAAAAIGKTGGAASFHMCDLADAGAVARLLAELPAADASPDILVNNAAVIDNAPFLDLDLAEFDRVLGVNLRSYFVLGQAVAKRMVAKVEAGGAPGSIINMSSVNDHFGLPDHVAYTVAKGGVRQLTRAMAIALAPHGIRVNAIGPGSIATPMLNNVMTDASARQRILSRTPLGRLGGPEEVAAIVSFLAGPDSSYITGETIYCDGGRIPLNYTVPVTE